MIHNEAHELRWKTVTLNEKAKDPARGILIPGAEFTVEDWVDRVNGESWQSSPGNFATVHYGIRVALAGLPVDDDVVYGKVGGLGHIVHVSELAT